MANFVKLHNLDNNKPIFINLDIIETIVDEDGYSALTGIRHWTSYRVRETVNEIFEIASKEGGE